MPKKKQLINFYKEGKDHTWIAIDGHLYRSKTKNVSDQPAGQSTITRYPGFKLAIQH